MTRFGTYVLLSNVQSKEESRDEFKGAGDLCRREGRPCRREPTAKHGHTGQGCRPQPGAGGRSCWTGHRDRVLRLRSAGRSGIRDAGCRRAVPDYPAALQTGRVGNASHRPSARGRRPAHRASFRASRRPESEYPNDSLAPHCRALSAGDGLRLDDCASDPVFSELHGSGAAQPGGLLLPARRGGPRVPHGHSRRGTGAVPNVDAGGARRTDVYGHRKRVAVVSRHV